MAKSMKIIKKGLFKKQNKDINENNLKFTLFSKEKSFFINNDNK